MRMTDRAALRDAGAAGAAAALVSGAPSTLHALATGGRPAEASLGAGTLVFPNERRPAPLLAAVLAVHLGLSLGWALVLEAVLPPRHALAFAPLAGLAIAALDLGVVGRRFPRVRALPVAPQIADHVAYALTVSLVLDHRRSRRDG